MFRLMIKCFLCLIIALLTGCKTEAEIPVRFSDFNAKSTHKIQGKLIVEIPACKDYNSDMPSDSLFKIKQKLPYVFKGAKFENCFEKNFSSYALFSFPVSILKSKTNLNMAQDTINISFDKNKSGFESLFVFIPDKLRSSINKMIKSEIFIKKSDLKITFALDPEGKKGSFQIIGGYLNNKPVQFGIFNNNGEKFKVTIPSYGIDLLVSGDYKYIAMHNAKF